MANGIVHKKKQPISALKEGDVVDDIFVVKIKKGMQPYANGFSFHLLLSDHSGKTIDYKYWGGPAEHEVKQLYDPIMPDSVLKVQGRVSAYGGRLQISTNPPHTIQVLEAGQYETADFVKPPRRDIGVMESELMGYIELMDDEALRRFMRGLFDDPALREAFAVHPGAIEIHHQWTGGLLEHTLQILAYCRLSREMFPELNKNLLIAGAILHDIGKLEEIEVTARVKGTTAGQLIGHSVLGALAVHRRLEDSDIDQITKMKLLHMMVSHLGRLEFGAAKPPMFPEAVVLHYADDLSAKTAEIIEFVREAKEETEDEFMYHRREQKNVFLR